MIKECLLSAKKIKKNFKTRERIKRNGVKFLSWKIPKFKKNISILSHICTIRVLFLLIFACVFFENLIIIIFVGYSCFFMYENEKNAIFFLKLNRTMDSDCIIMYVTYFLYFDSFEIDFFSCDFIENEINFISKNF